MRFVRHSIVVFFEMGSCVSRTITEEHHHTDPNPAPDVARVVLNEGHKLKDFISAAIPLFPPNSGSSTDESFYDAQLWVESDCDEEFYSINGDYTPSPGIPNIHRRFSTGTPLLLTPSPLNSNVPHLVKVSSAPSRTPLQVIFAAGAPESNELVNEKELTGCKSEASTVDKRMRLLELFRLSRGGFADEHLLFDKRSTDTKTVSGTTISSSSIAPAAASVSSSKRTSNASSKYRRSIKAVHPIDCIRKLRSGRHKNDRND